MTTAGGGWTLAMRTQAGGDSFNYESRHWSTDSVLNEINLANGGFDSSEAKFTAFNVIPSSEILIKTSSGKNTQLGMSRVSTLLDLFKGPTTRLDVISGEASPQKLMSGGSSTVCGAAWRTNSKGSYNFMIRIGGFFSHSWGCNYGNDSTGSPTGAEEAGLGLWDEQWAPLRPSVRSSSSCTHFLHAVDLLFRVALPVFVRLTVTILLLVAGKILSPLPCGFVKALI